MLDVVGVGRPNVDEDAYRDMATALREFDELDAWLRANGWHPGREDESGNRNEADRLITARVRRSADQGATPTRGASSPCTTPGPASSGATRSRPRPA